MYQNIKSRLERIVIIKLSIRVLPGHDDEGELHYDVVIDLGGLGHGVHKVAAVNKLAVRKPGWRQVTGDLELQIVVNLHIKRLNLSLDAWAHLWSP